MNNTVIREVRRIVVGQNPDGRDILFDGRKYYFYPIDSNKIMEAASLKEARNGYFKKDKP
jgi:hypothetical protein